MAHFTVEKLHKDQLREAWPVVRTADLEANIEWWVNDATAMIERGGGVFVARAADGHIHGVAAYKVTHKPPNARVLAAEVLISFELNRRAPVRKALCEALEQAAKTLDCTGVLLPLSARAA